MQEKHPIRSPYYGSTTIEIYDLEKNVQKREGKDSMLNKHKTLAKKWSVRGKTLLMICAITWLYGTGVTHIRALLSLFDPEFSVSVREMNREPYLPLDIYNAVKVWGLRLLLMMYLRGKAELFHLGTCISFVLSVGLVLVLDLYMEPAMKMGMRTGDDSGIRLKKRFEGELQRCIGGWQYPETAQYSWWKMRCLELLQGVDDDPIMLNTKHHGGNIVLRR